MPAETLAEQVSEMIWNDYSNRCSHKGFIYEDGTVDPGVTLTEFMKEAHEVVLQLLSEFPEIKLAPGEYLLEDDEENGPEFVMAGETGRWKSYSVQADGTFTLQRPYDEEANDLIVARDFPNVEAMQVFIEAEAEAAASFEAGVDAGYQIVADQVRDQNLRNGRDRRTVDNRT